MRPLSLALLAAGVLLAAPVAAPAQPKADPDWPCIQRKTPEIDLAQVWNGPDPASAGRWTDDQEAAAVAQKIASRRTPMDEVDVVLQLFAREAGPDASTRLLRVMAGAYEIINTERSRVMHGIERYARGQQRLADRIREEGDKLSQARTSSGSTDTAETKALDEQLTWDARIFDERARSLTYVCEMPVLLEQRAYEIGERIAARMKGG
ncbi:hypothetical protein K9U40_09705 [Xanthobacter autotrophicus]|uniref:hypothetical protein n=1 Tax=Xanthobacter TaxID=279 RepID=UPI0024AC6C6D|nr:hypothetical protein [Xanthobacter autotrophicus]MDI4664597.1 hypothetical protein [Xanthobacter autotrophicus]